MTAAKVASDDLLRNGLQAGAVVTAPTIGFLLKQVYALHKDIVRGLETRVIQLTRDLAESQTSNSKVEASFSYSATNASQAQVPSKERSQPPKNCKRRRLGSQIDDSSDVSEQEDGCVLVSEINAAERKQPYRSLQRRRFPKRHQCDAGVKDPVKLFETESNAVQTFEVNKERKNLECEKKNSNDNSEILCLNTPYVVDIENGIDSIHKCGIVAETLGVNDGCELYADDSREEKPDGKIESKSNAANDNAANKLDKPVRAQKHKPDPVHKMKSRGTVSPVLFVEDEDDDIIVQRVATGVCKLREMHTEYKLESTKASGCTENKPELSRRAGFCRNSKTDLAMLKSLNGQVEIVNGGKERVSSKSSKKTDTYVIEFDPNAKPLTSVKLKQTKITKDSFNALSKPRLRSASSLDQVPVTKEMEQQWLQEALRKSLLQDEKHNQMSNGNTDSDLSSGSDQSISLLNTKANENITSVSPEKNYSPESRSCDGQSVGLSRNVKVVVQQLRNQKNLATGCERQAYKTNDAGCCALIDPSPRKTYDKRTNSSISNIEDNKDSLDETCIGSPTLLENLQPVRTFNTSLKRTNCSLIPATRKVEDQVTKPSDDTFDETCGPSQLLLELGLPEAEQPLAPCNGSLDPNIRLSLYETCVYNEDDDEESRGSKLTGKRVSDEVINVQKRDELSDFDRVPKKQTVPFKYKELPVRNREDRKKLEGYACKCCKDYYEAVGLTEEEIKERMKDCSRHRDRHAPPQTPEHFWSIGFPDTPECKARGYILPTQVRPLRRKQKKRLLEGSLITAPDDSFLQRDK